MTIRGRLTLWYGVTFMLLVVVVAVAVWWQVDLSLRRSALEALEVHAADVARGLAEGSSVSDLAAPRARDIFTLVEDPSGGYEAGAGVPGELPDDLPMGASVRPLPDEGAEFGFYRLRLGDGRVVTAGRPLAAFEQSAARSLETLLLIGILAVLGSLVGGWWLAGRALEPMRRLQREADAIGPGELGRRLPVAQPEDEVGRLASTLNRFLTRVEEGVARERAFITGAAHDLRTPVASLRMRTEQLMGRTEIDKETRVGLDDIRQDAVALGHLADSLLALAEAQAQGQDDAVTEHVLPLLVARAEQEVEWPSRLRDIRIETSVDEVSVRISPVRFHQALANLLSNAVRHSPDGGTIALSARVRSASEHGSPVVMVTVLDQGTGVDDALREQLFVPFATRRHGSTTHGLGLATAAAAVSSQGGGIGFRDGASGGSEFWFWIPIAEAKDAPASRSAGQAQT